MKYFGYVFRNVSRNKLRLFLTVSSIAVSLFLLMILLSFITMNEEQSRESRQYDRLVTMGSGGFASPVPIARVAEIAAMPGVDAASAFRWYGGKYGDDPVPFGQFGVDPDCVMKIMSELKVPPEQEKAFREDRTGCVIGYKLAADKHATIGSKFPLKGDIFPFDLDLTVRGIYVGPAKTDNRMCMFHWSYLDEGLKKLNRTNAVGNAGVVFIKVKRGVSMPDLIKRIDDAYRNSPEPTRTQTEEAFGQMFLEMMGSFRTFIVGVGVAVAISLILICGVSMAMSMRERTTEVAVLKAIGFSRPLILFLALSESILIAAIGGFVGAIGTKVLFDYFDLAPYTGGFLPFFYVPWSTAVLGLIVATGIGFVSGLIPAIRASLLSVIDGLRKVV